MTTTGALPPGVAHHVRFDTPGGISARQRFEYWRSWYGQAIDVPMRLDPLGRLPASFDASADVLSAGQADLIELHCGPATGRWNRHATEPAQRLRLVLLAPCPGGTGYWHGQQLSLDRGCAALLGGTDGWWRAPAGLHGVQINLPRAAFQVSDTELHEMNRPRLMQRDRVLTGLVRPTLSAAAGHLDSLAGNAARTSAVWISLVGMLVRSLRGQDLDGAETAPARRVLAERFIQARLADPRLTPDTVADALHLSRRALYASVFADDGGVASYIRTQRLARAHELLTTTSLPVSAVAAAVGLPNAAHFSRLFHASRGRSPRALRDQTSPQPPPAAGR